MFGFDQIVDLNEMFVRVKLHQATVRNEAKVVCIRQPEHRAATIVLTRLRWNCPFALELLQLIADQFVFEYFIELSIGLP